MNPYSMLCEECDWHWLVHNFHSSTSTRIILSQHYIIIFYQDLLNFKLVAYNETIIVGTSYT